MPTMAEKLWTMGKTPAQGLNLLLFGLISLLGGVLLRAILISLAVTNAAAVGFVAAVLSGIGAFFITFALFLGAYVAEDEHVAWRVAALIGAVVLVLFLLR